MNELTFRIAYGAASVVIIGALMLLLPRGLDRNYYLRPVLVGFILGSLFVWGFGANEFGLLMAGCIVGYLAARGISGWNRQLRTGGLMGVLFMPNIIFAIAYDGFKHFAQLWGYSFMDPSGKFLAQISVSTLMTAFVFVAFAGIGAVLGGFLRKALKPAQPRPTTAKDSEK